jgi:hypothetical protein
MLAHAQHESAGHDREHARSPDGFRHAVAGPRHHEGEYDAELRIDQAHEQRAHRLTTHEAHRDTEQDESEEKPCAACDRDRGGGQRR